MINPTIAHIAVGCLVAIIAASALAQVQPSKTEKSRQNPAVPSKVATSSATALAVRTDMAAASTQPAERLPDTPTAKAIVGDEVAEKFITGMFSDYSGPIPNVSHVNGTGADLSTSRFQARLREMTWWLAVR